MYVRIYTSSGRWVTDVMTYIYVVWSLKYYVILYPRLLIKFCIYSLGTQRFKWMMTLHCGRHAIAENYMTSIFEFESDVIAKTLVPSFSWH